MRLYLNLHISLEQGRKQLLHLAQQHDINANSDDDIFKVLMKKYNTRKSLTDSINGIGGGSLDYSSNRISLRF